MSTNPPPLEPGSVLHIAAPVSREAIAVRITAKKSGSIFRIERVADGCDLGFIGRIGFIEYCPTRTRKGAPTMTKDKFLANLAAIYRVANMSDSDNPQRPEWVHHEMAATVCQPLDKIMQALEACGVIDADERQSFYDDL